MDQLGPLLDRLTAAHFTGELRLRFDAGSIATAELHHFLGRDNFELPLAVIEGDTQSSGKP
jgi:hypothetical protein